MTRTTLLDVIGPALELLDDSNLRNALSDSFAAESESLKSIENCFYLLATRKWSDQFLARFFSSWKATHLKMLGIYGLSCRLQKLAGETSDTRISHQLLRAGALNAESSHEDLGIEYGGITHAELYESLAHGFLKTLDWKDDRFCLPDAQAFRRWIYRNMVVEDIRVGLLTNLFSEIYNHAEYTLAYSAFSNLVDAHYNFTGAEKSRALLYIRVHVDENTEVGHFLVVSKALHLYEGVVGSRTERKVAATLFADYLSRLGIVMDRLTALMLQEAHPYRSSTKTGAA